jgi:twitching motility protein PilT
MIQPDERLLSLLDYAKEHGASDLHLSVGTVPRIRVRNELLCVEGQDKLLPDDTKRMIYSVMEEKERAVFEENGEADFAFGIEGKGRYRANAYRQRNTCCCALRLMSGKIQNPEELGIPDAVMELSKMRSGLVLVTGPTGCGKSTTLAAIIQAINKTRHCHVITLEDPIEYLYHHDQAIVDQREIGVDSKSFSGALRAALREDPDVLLVGEMRDLDTISTAITAAETGHLVFSTLHTLNAATTVDRIIDVFPDAQQAQIRTQLASVLEAVISQRLIPAAQGTRRVAVFEILRANSAIRNLIRTGRSNMIAGQLAQGQREGMNTLDQALADACRAGRITQESAMLFAEDLDAMKRNLGIR